MRLLVISSKLHRGGAESHTLGLINQIALMDGIQVDLFVTQRAGNYESQISPLVRVFSHPFNLKSYTLSLLCSLFQLVLMRKNYDKFLSIQDGPIIVSLLALSSSRTTIVVQNNPRNWSSLKIGALYNILSRYLYRRSAGLISLSHGVLRDYQQKIVLPKKTKVIPNLVQLSSEPFSNIDIEKVNILSVGRLAEQKDYFTALKVIQRLRNHYGIKLSYKIVGNGELEQKLRDLSAELGIDDVVSFEGYRKNVEDYYRNANIFLLTSQYEGFGNVIVEAQSYGLPVVSTDCDYGPNEILVDELSQWLAPVGDIHTLTELLYRIIENQIEWRNISVKSYHNSKRFDHGKLAQEYIDFIA